jgi:hypothetical protein
MRNTLQLPDHLADERPSRLSRVLVILSTIGVALIAAWVFVPILLANYMASSSPYPQSRGVAQQPVVAAPVAANTTPVAVPEADPTPAAPPPVTAAVVDTPSTPAWPTDTTAVAAAEPGALQLAVVAPTAAAAEPADPAADTSTENVPLPRKRPSLAIAARLTIPLPRPRPEIDGDAPSPDLTAFERQVDRQR